MSLVHSCFNEAGLENEDSAGTLVFGILESRVTSPFKRMDAAQAAVHQTATRVTRSEERKEAQAPPAESLLKRESADELRDLFAERARRKGTQSRVHPMTDDAELLGLDALPIVFFCHLLFPCVTHLALSHSRLLHDLAVSTSLSTMVAMFVFCITLFVFAMLGPGHNHEGAVDGHLQEGCNQKVFHGTSG